MSVDGHQLQGQVSELPPPGGTEELNVEKLLLLMLRAFVEEQK
jgi:hypothetical protein